MADTQVDDLKAEIQNLKDELERLKGEKRFDIPSSWAADDIRDEVEEVQKQVDGVVENSGFSRRDFMKLVGGGAAGLGAAAMLPSVASAFKVESDNALQYFNQSSNTASFSVTPDGNLTTNQIGTASDKIQDIHASSITTEELSTVYRHRIASASDLESIDSELSQGDVAYVEQPDTPYRTSSWIDIDTQDVTVVFESRWAKDGSPIVKVADEANVGGIRIGTGSTQITGVTVRGFGFHGNKANQTSGNRHHGVIVDNADGAIVEDCFVTRTHPYHEHNTGGSGISVERQAVNVTVRRNRIDDIGDRGIQSGADRVTISNNIFTNGYDRAVSLIYQDNDGNHYIGKSTVVANNVSFKRAEGSHYGVNGGNFSGATSGESANRILFIGNIAFGEASQGRSLAKAVDLDGSVDSNIGFIGNVGREGTRPGIDISISANPPVEGVIVGNVLREFSDPGIVAPATFAVVGNTITNCTKHGINLNTTAAEGATCIGNTIDTVDQHGIRADAKHGIIMGNTIRDPDQASGTHHGIALAGADNMIVAGNNIFGGDNGIDDSGVSDNCIIVNNRLVGQNSNAFNITNNGNRLFGNKPRHYDLDETLSLSSGGTATSSAISRASVGDDIEINVTPNADPNNDLKFEYRSFWDDSAGSLKVEVNEVAAAGGGDARVTAKVVG